MTMLSLEDCLSRLSFFFNRDCVLTITTPILARVLGKVRLQLSIDQQPRLQVHTMHNEVLLFRLDRFVAEDSRTACTLCGTRL